MLVRLVRLPNGIVVADSGARAAGRGAYVCPGAECVERALSRGRLGHAFKKPSEAGPDLAAVVRAAGQREAAVPATVASPEVAWLCEVGASAIGDVDVITVRA
jgi:predicted RNA-binding protein YlxR (DUF448 family)